MQLDELSYEQFHFPSKLRLITDILNDTLSDPNKNKEEVIKIINSFSSAEAFLFCDNLNEDSILSENLKNLIGDGMA